MADERLQQNDAQKYLRVLDHLDQAAEAASELRPSREVACVKTKIDEALHWLGQVAERPRLPGDIEALYESAAALGVTEQVHCALREIIDSAKAG